MIRRERERPVRIDVEGARVARLRPRAGAPGEVRPRGRAAGGAASCALMLAMLACGLWGFARLACAMARLPCDPLAAALWGMLPCLPACAAAAWRPQAAGPAVLACFGVWTCAFGALHREALAQARAALDALLAERTAAGAGDVGTAAALACALLGCVLCALALLAHRGWTFALVCAPLLLICPQIGCDPGWQTGALLLGYHALALAFDQGGRRFGRTRPGAAACALAVAAVAVAVAVPLCDRWGGALGSVPQALDRQVAELVAAWQDRPASTSDDGAGDGSPAGAAPAADVAGLLEEAGTVGRDDLAAVDGALAALSVDVRPAATVYLSSFSGGSYGGDVWTAADDAAAGFRAEGLASTAHAALGALGVPALALDVSSAGSALDPRALVPYAALETSYDAATGTVRYATYDLGSYDDLASCGATLAAPGADAQGYAAWALQAYTRVPLDEVPRLARLVADNPMPDLASAVRFVQETLAENARYTTEPGAFPDGVDVAEYLLFEGHAGYCQHFATAATLMLRLYGYPARYATGLAVPAAAFARQADGTWSATADGLNAHAWAEVYVDGVGWVPVETTPAGSGAAPWGGGAASGTGGSGDAAEETGSQGGEGPDGDAGSGAADEPAGADAGAAPDGVAPDDAGADDAGTGGAVDDAAGVQGDAGAAAPGRPSPAALAAAALAAVAALAGGAAGVLAARRRRAAARRKEAPANEVLAELVEVLHYGGLLADMDGTEEGFAAALAQAVPAVAPDEAERLAEEGLRAAFGPEADRAAPCDPRTRAAYRAVCERVRADLPPLRRLAFRYLRAFD